MFYSTKIKSLGAGGAIDVNGRWLRFIGRLPVKEGDTVYTDGNVIFGNAPPKGAPMIVPDDPSGIPVLGKKDSKGNELRGYFTTKGKYKPYKIAGNAWITNGQKIYAHDNGEDNIIDAEIALDENGNESGFYTVEKKVTLYDENYDNDYIWFIPDSLLSVSIKTMKCGINLDLLKKTNLRLYDNWDNLPNGVDIPKFFLTIKFKDCDYARRNDDYCKQTTLAIKKDDILIENIELSQLMERIEAIAFLNVTCVSINDFERLNTTKDYIKSRACLINFKITPNGTWTALLDVEIIVERGFFHVYDHLYPGTLELESTTIHNVLQYSPRIDEYITRRSLNVTPARIVPETCYDSTTAIWRGMIKITSESDEPEIIFSKVGAFPLVLRNQNVIVKEGHESDFDLYATEEWYFPKIRKSVNSAYTFGQWWISLPFDGGYYSYEYEQRDWYGILIKEERTFSPFNDIAFFTNTEFDSRNLEGTPDYNNCELNPDYNNYELTIKDNFTVPVQDDYQAKLLLSYYNNTSNETFWKIGGLLDKDNKQVIGEILPYDTDAHKWNMSVAPLKDNNFLFGIHGDEKRDIAGKLVLIREDGQVEQVGEGLKNFRLRELKKMSKAKK